MSAWLTARSNRTAHLPQPSVQKQPAPGPVPSLLAHQPLRIRLNVGTREISKQWTLEWRTTLRYLVIRHYHLLQQLLTYDEDLAGPG